MRIGWVVIQKHHALVKIRAPRFSTFFYFFIFCDFSMKFFVLIPKMCLKM